jgi:putative intracellular protease/amidase
VREFWALERPVGAICHSVLVLARAGVLRKSRTTCLTKSMEKGAYLLTSWRLGSYYRTYPTYVQDEVVAALANATQFDAGPIATYSRPWVVEDGRYVSGRWPGDASLFAQRFEALLSAGPRPQPAAATPRRAT